MSLWQHVHTQNCGAAPHGLVWRVKSRCVASRLGAMLPHHREQMTRQVIGVAPQPLKEAERELARERRSLVLEPHLRPGVGGEARRRRGEETGRGGEPAPRPCSHASPGTFLSPVDFP